MPIAFTDILRRAEQMALIVLVLQAVLQPTSALTPRGAVVFVLVWATLHTAVARAARRRRRQNPA
jgi:hypothetical protein